MLGEIDEIWRFVPDFWEYAVSTHGRVAHTRHERILKDVRGVDGRRWVALYVCGVRTNKYVHQIMGRAFVVGFEWGDEVGHLNGDCSDNHISNLNFKRYNFGLELTPEWEWEGDPYGWWT